MTTQEIRSVLTISLLAAYADSDKHAREREEIRRIAEGLSQADEVNLPTLYQDVLLKRTNLAQAIAGLPSMESRQLAYEMAVCVCDADGSTSERERAFLGELHQALGLEQQFAQQTLHDGEAMAQAPLQTATGAPVAAASALAAPITPQTAAPAAAPAQPAGRPSTLDEQAMKQKILRAATLNGAIELLPESLSTMAIIPLQMRLVYQIGQSYGYELDKGHIRDFLATIGVGMTSQYLEQAGRKLLGGLLGKAGKGLLGGLGKQAVSSGMSFAATYALGHVANQYYAAGRSISAQMLKDSYAHMLQDGRQLHTQYLPDMRQQAQGLNATRLMSLVRGNSQAF
ncbi:YcjF family protein [Vandammella animalimorsus]|uniref:GTPase n=1 Tax=Vandammella animalimorsus TaxID=2029117 RepID=A0A2A2ALS9_9BURK|nr:TerB family tellurite resistance protein [Vandammella animalimorsus]PAT38786.1 GTPase [Vandammella animalimorsus]